MCGSIRENSQTAYPLYTAYCKNLHFNCDIGSISEKKEYMPADGKAILYITMQTDSGDFLSVNVFQQIDGLQM